MSLAGSFGAPSPGSCLVGGFSKRHTVSVHRSAICRWVPIRRIRSRGEDGVIGALPYGMRIINIDDGSTPEVALSHKRLEPAAMLRSRRPSRKSVRF